MSDVEAEHFRTQGLPGKNKPLATMREAAQVASLTAKCIFAGLSYALELLSVHIPHDTPDPGTNAHIGVSEN